MNYDPKIGVLGSGRDFYKGGYVRLSQITRLELPTWIGRIENGWQQKLVQMDEDYYFRIDMRIPPLPPTPLDTWHSPPEDPSGYDPNYQAIILTPIEAYQWLIREGYEIPDDLTKLKPAETEQNATPAKPERESWWLKLYEKTLKVIVDAVMERLWPKQ